MSWLRISVCRKCTVMSNSEHMNLWGCAGDICTDTLPQGIKTCLNIAWRLIWFCPEQALQTADKGIAHICAWQIFRVHAIRHAKWSNVNGSTGRYVCTESMAFTTPACTWLGTCLLMFKGQCDHVPWLRTGFHSHCVLCKFDFHSPSWPRHSHLSNYYILCKYIFLAYLPLGYDENMQCFV